MGIPCSHTISHLIEVNLKVSAAHFDAFWLYDRPVPAPPVPDPLHDVPAQFGMIDLTNIDPLLPDPAEIHIPPPPPAQFCMIDLTNTDPLLPDPADVPPLPPAVLPPLKVRAKGRPRKDNASTKRQPSAWERNGGPRSSAARNTPRASTSAIVSTQSVSSTSTTIAPAQITSTSISSASTVTPSTQYPSDITTAIDLATSETITSQNNEGSIIHPN